jgi:hypothetical protein
LKNLLIIILLALAFFALAFAVYFVGFKFYFSSDKLTKKAQRLVRMTFQRESEFSKINLSPWGTMDISSFSMAQKGGFKVGTTLSVQSLKLKAVPSKFLKRELVFNPFEISGIVLNLNYANKRKFDYKAFFENVKYLFYSRSAKHGLVRSAEIENISIIGSSVILNIGAGKIVFSNISLKIARIDFGDRILGSGSFDFSFEEVKTSASFNFVYKVQDSTLEIQNLICEDFSVSADVKIKLNADGSVTPEYTARVNKKKLLEALKDFPTYAGFINLAYPEAIDEIILIYPR